MIEVKGNTLIIKVTKKEDTAIFGEIIDFVKSPRQRLNDQSPVVAFIIHI